MIEVVEESTVRELREGTCAQEFLKLQERGAWNVGMDWNGVSEEVREEFIKARAAKEQALLRAAFDEQERIGRELRGEVRAIDGIGGQTLNVSTTAFWYWANRFGGLDCWNDKGFRREYARDNPAARVKSTGTRIQSGYRGSDAAPAAQQIETVTAGGCRTRVVYASGNGVTRTGTAATFTR
jgi:hypothetical protein